MKTFFKNILYPLNCSDPTAKLGSCKNGNFIKIGNIKITFNLFKNAFLTFFKKFVVFFKSVIDQINLILMQKSKWKKQGNIL